VENLLLSGLYVKETTVIDHDTRIYWVTLRALRRRGRGSVPRPVVSINREDDVIWVCANCRVGTVVTLSGFATT
jgi:hypothetical protein